MQMGPSREEGEGGTGPGLSGVTWQLTGGCLCHLQSLAIQPSKRALGKVTEEPTGQGRINGSFLLKATKKASCPHHGFRSFGGFSLPCSLPPFSSLCTCVSLPYTFLLFLK